MIFEEVCNEEFIFTRRMMARNKNIKIFINYFLGPILFICLSYILYKRISGQENLPLRWQQVKAGFTNPLLWLGFFLVFINWGLEALKWRQLLLPLEKVSFVKAYKSVLAGCAITMLTPNRIGEYGGRILYLKDENRVAAIPLNILGSICQLSVTIFGGCIALLFLDNEVQLKQIVPPLVSKSIIFGGFIIAFILLLIYFRAGVVVQLLLKAKIFQKFMLKLQEVVAVRNKDLLRILFYSVLRYAVFIIQYILVLYAMDVKLPLLLAFGLLSIFYLVLTAAPTIGFTELPLRAAASVEILQLYNNNVLGMHAASLCIWLVNLILPAIVGSMLLIGIKFIKDKNGYT